MQQRQKSKLMEFMERFDSAECILDDGDIPYDKGMSKPLLLLARAFENSGEYQKTIGIYLYLIRYEKSRELLEHLGKIYLRAGFLERAEVIFLEILSRTPRDIGVLYQLGVVYELLHQYDKALETLEPLETLGEGVDELRNFWEFKKIEQNSELSSQDREIALVDIQSRSPSLYRHTIAALFELLHVKAWRYVAPRRSREVLDILWYLPKSQLDFDIIQSDNSLSKIYFARGVIKEIDLEQVGSSGIVNIDILASSKSAGEHRGELSFGYLCARCKHSFPIAFSRCPNCLAINSLITEEQISKHDERDYSIF